MTEEKLENKKLDFLVIREDWSEYKLVTDGTKVKIKASVSDIVDVGKKGKKREVRLAFNNVFYKEVSADDKGEPSENPIISEEDVIQELEYEKIREPLNIYDVPNKFIIIVRTSLTELKKTRKFDSKGNRIYHYGISCLVNVVEYPK